MIQYAFPVGAPERFRKSPFYIVFHRVNWPPAAMRVGWAERKGR